VREVYIRGSFSPNFWVDISDTMELKIAALKKHESQVGRLQGWEERVRGRARDEAIGQDMTYAESFRRITLS